MTPDTLKSVPYPSGCPVRDAPRMAEERPVAAQHVAPVLPYTEPVSLR